MSQSIIISIAKFMSHFIHWLWNAETVYLILPLWFDIWALSLLFSYFVNICVINPIWRLTKLQPWRHYPSQIGLTVAKKICHGNPQWRCHGLILGRLCFCWVPWGNSGHISDLQRRWGRVVVLGVRVGAVTTVIL